MRGSSRARDISQWWKQLSPPVAYFVHDTGYDAHSCLCLYIEVVSLRCVCFLAQTDLTGADVVTMYLATSLNEKLRPRLEKYLKPGTRVISHDYPMPSWKPVDVVEFETEDKVPITGTRRTVLLLYRVPDKTR